MSSGSDLETASIFFYVVTEARALDLWVGDIRVFYHNICPFIKVHYLTSRIRLESSRSSILLHPVLSVARNFHVSSKAWILRPILFTHRRSGLSTGLLLSPFGPLLFGTFKNISTLSHIWLKKQYELEFYTC